MEVPSYMGYNIALVTFMMENPHKYLAFHAIISNLSSSATPIYTIVTFSKCYLFYHFSRTPNPRLIIKSLENHF